MNIGIDARFWMETGVGRYTRNLIKELQEIDKKNSYILFVRKKDAENVIRQLTDQISNIPSGFFRASRFQIEIADIRWHTVREQFEFPKLLNRYDLDLMHFPYFSVPIYYNKPFIITIHDLILHHFPTGEASTLPLPLYRLKHQAYKMIIEKAAQKAEKIIAVSHATKQEIKDHLAIRDEKIAVIYEGIDKGLVTTGKDKEEKNTILHVGNLYPHKNMDRLLDALLLCIEKNIDLKLVIVGRKDYFFKKFYDKLRHLGLTDHVIIKGEVTDRELSELYAASSATIIPSLMEGFGLPALEAMANKCLVLASNIPSLKEVCGDAAVYFEPLDAADIAKKIQHVLTLSTDKKREKIAIGYNRTKLFTWKKMAEKTLEVYESCTSLRPGK